MNIRNLLISAFAIATWSTVPAMAATPAAFTATYNVLQGRQAMGTATVKLRAADDGEWIYSKDVKGTAGLAAMLGASITESSRFRWKGDLPEAISYDYRLRTGFKNKQRHMQVDWANHEVSVDEGKGAQTYPTRPGIVERNTLPLALGVALRQDKRKISLPVASRRDVQTQTFEVTGREDIKVPAGSFHAERVDRTDAELGFSAWYAPEKYLLPVKLSQSDGGNLTMELVSYQTD